MDRTYFEFTTNQLWDEFLANKWNWNVLSDLAEELKWRHRPGARGLAAQVKRQLELAKTWTVRNYQGADRIERSFEALKQKLEVKRQEREAELAEARALVTVQPGDTLVLGNGAMIHIELPGLPCEKPGVKSVPSAHALAQRLIGASVGESVELLNGKPEKVIEIRKPSQGFSVRET